VSKRVDTKEALADKLSYNQWTGILTWKNTGKKAGWKNNGYIRIGKHGIYAQQIVVYKMLGYWPEEVDHKDHDTLNNKWDNLRPTDRVGNNRNVRVSKNNRSGVLHVHIHPNGYDVRVGKFFRAFTTDFDMACIMAHEARQKYYGAYA
jgi:hypothetical protein